MKQTDRNHIATLTDDQLSAAIYQFECTIKFLRATNHLSSIRASSEKRLQAYVDESQNRLLAIAKQS